MAAAKVHSRGSAKEARKGKKRVED